jgi:hypothetical protein
MLAAPLLAGAWLGAGVRRPRLAWLGVVGVLVFLALNGPIIDGLTPDRCQGLPDCPDPGTHLFAYVVMGYALTAATAGFAIAATRARGKRRLKTSTGSKALSIAFVQPAIDASATAPAVDEQQTAHGDYCPVMQPQVIAGRSLGDA